MTDVVAAQHRKQEYEGEYPDALPGAVIDPAPPPRRGRHFSGVDAVEVLYLSTGHGESLSDRIGVRTHCPSILAQADLPVRVCGLKLCSIETHGGVERPRGQHAAVDLGASVQVRRQLR